MFTVPHRMIKLTEDDFEDFFTQQEVVLKYDSVEMMVNMYTFQIKMNCLLFKCI